ncbi:hypothetical protein [Achromobacter denitrificans]|uniref:hypothetical protein n=1 Tax=Achromobacter denitrificans TaxID=32002 RepID=UPI00240D406A|nr:hypothetical protein [Achromobacter denitrificans]
MQSMVSRIRSVALSEASRRLRRVACNCSDNLALSASRSVASLSLSVASSSSIQDSGCRERRRALLLSGPFSGKSEGRGVFVVAIDSS